MMKINMAIEFMETKHDLILKSLITTILVAGIGYSFYLGSSLRYPDEADYYHIAYNLISNHKYTIDGYNPTAFSITRISPHIGCFFIFGG